MSDTTNNPNPAEPPVNQGGGTAPQSESDSNTDSEGRTAEPPVNQGGGSAG